MEDTKSPEQGQATVAIASELAEVGHAIDELVERFIALELTAELAGVLGDDEWNGPELPPRHTFVAGATNIPPAKSNTHAVQMPPGFTPTALVVTDRAGNIAGDVIVTKLAIDLRDSLTGQVPASALFSCREQGISPFLVERTNRQERELRIGLYNAGEHPFRGYWRVEGVLEEPPIELTAAPGSAPVHEIAFRVGVLEDLAALARELEEAETDDEPTARAAAQAIRRIILRRFNTSTPELGIFRELEDLARMLEVTIQGDDWDPAVLELAATLRGLVERFSGGAGGTPPDSPKGVAAAHASPFGTFTTSPEAEAAITSLAGAPAPLDAAVWLSLLIVASFDVLDSTTAIRVVAAARDRHMCPAEVGRAFELATMALGTTHEWTYTDAFDRGPLELFGVEVGNMLERLEAADRRGHSMVPWIQDGYPALAWWAPSSEPAGGHWCGYLFVHEDHPWHDPTFDIETINVHERANFWGPINEWPMSEPGRWIGFDCAHLVDVDEPKDLDFVRGELERMAREADEATKRSGR